MVASPGAWSSPGGGSPASARSRSPSNVGSPNRNGSDGGGGDPSCRVSVAVRIRPLLGQELSDGSVECITTDECDRKQVVVGGGPDNRFTFDHVFTPRDRQAAIYQECVGPLVAAHLDGYNATILAYGQTGSGKTHTMGSASNLTVAEQDQGIIPRVIDELFCTLAARRQEAPASSYRVSVQFLEIYGEEVKDLLDPLSPRRVAIREQPGGGIAVIGAREEAVGSAEEMMLVLERGTLCRTTGATLMNQSSSRSHAIFTVLLEHRIARGNGGGGAGAAGGEAEAAEGAATEGSDVRTEVRKSKFHFVDLAGSERAKRTGAQGKRLKEGIEINKGLLVLGNVISALGDARKKAQHVPYRDSKLTRMLQDSLGGNSQTLMIACVSPAEVNLQESLNALRYANRARNIRNKPVLNRDRESVLVEELRQQVQALATELLRLKKGGQGDSGNGDGSMKEEALVRLLQGGACGAGACGGGVGMREAAGVGKDEAATALAQRCEIVEAEVRRLAEENAKLRQQYSEASDEIIQLTADRDYYRLCLHEATGAASNSSKDTQSPTTSSSSASDEQEQQPQEQEEQGAEAGASPLASQCGPFTDHLRPYLHEIRALQRRVKELEQAQAQALAAQQQQGRRRSSASAFLLSSLLAAEGAPAGGGAGGLLPSLLLDSGAAVASATGDGGSSPLQMQQAHQETELEKDLRLVTEAEAGAFYRAHQEMSATVADLTRGIELKERLAAQLCESIKRYEVMRRVYEEKLRAMAEETARYEADRQKLLYELEQLEKRLLAGGGAGGQKPAQQHTQQHEALLRRIQEKEAQLQAATKKEEELGRLARQAQKTEGQLKQLNDEIAGMKRQKMDLLHKMDAERRKFQALLREKTQEIESMRRAAQRDAKEIQRLEQAVEKADKERRKQEEDFNRHRPGTLALFSSSGDANGGLLALHRTTATAHRAQKVQGRRFSSAAADRLRYSEEERRTKKWLDARIREVAKREEAAERLAAEYQRRMALLKTKEDLEQARVKFFSTRRAGAAVVPAATTVRDVILGAHGPQEEEGVVGVEGTAGAEAVVAPAPLTPEEEATLEELEERITACKAQLEFKDDRIRKFETIVNARSTSTSTSSAGGSNDADGKRHGGSNGNSEGEPVRLQVAKSCQTLEQSHAVIRVLFDMLVTTRREAKANGDRSKELEDACQEAAQLLEAAEKRAEAERRLCEERLTRVAMDYEEKISGLIDSAATSGLFVVPAAAVPSVAVVSAAGGEREAGAEGEGEQLRCMLRLSNERNEVLRGQMQQLQTAQEGVEARAADLEGREKKAREELRECQAQLKWAEFELTKVRSEYIKLRSERALLATIHQQQDPLAGLLMLQRTTASLISAPAPAGQQQAQQQQAQQQQAQQQQAQQQQAQQQRQQQEEEEEEVKRLEREVLGSGWDLEEDEDEDEEGEVEGESGSFGPEDGGAMSVLSAAAEGEQEDGREAHEGVDAPLHVDMMGTIPEEDGQQGDGKGEAEGDEDDDEEDGEGGGGGGGRAGTPSWARDVTADVHTHIKQGKAPPSILNRQSVKRALQAIAAAGGPGGVEEAGAVGGVGAHSTIFDRLADPAHFTGIHKLHEEEAKANRQRAERIRHNGEGIKKLLHAPQPSKPKGGSLAASMYATHGARAAVGHTHSPPQQQPQRHGSPGAGGVPSAAPTRLSPSVASAGAAAAEEGEEEAGVSMVVAAAGLGAEAQYKQGAEEEGVPAPGFDAHRGFAAIAEGPEEEQEAEAAMEAEAEGGAPIQQRAAPAAAAEQPGGKAQQGVPSEPSQPQQQPQPRRKSLPTQAPAAAAAEAGEEEDEEEEEGAGTPVSGEAAVVPSPPVNGKARKGFVSRMRKAFGLRS